MRDIDVAAICLCLVLGAVLFLRGELGRSRMGGFPDVSMSVRWALHLCAVLLVARAYRIATGFGEADVSEVLVYAALILASLLQVGALVRIAWCRKVRDARADLIPEVKEAVKEAASEAFPDYLQTLHNAPADYERRAAAYPPGVITPVDPTVPTT